MSNVTREKKLQTIIEMERMLNEIQDSEGLIKLL